MRFAPLAITLALALLVAPLAIAQTQNRVGTVQVSATVLGQRPLVYDFYDQATASEATAGNRTLINDVVTPLTAIIGRNFTGALVVTLDDVNSTPLTDTNGGTLADNIATSCDNDKTTAVCGTGTYDKLTNLSIPANVKPGRYSVLVTTAVGTNIASDVSLTVSPPTAGANASIIDVSPNPAIAEVSQAINFTLTDSHTNAGTTYYEITQNGGTWDAATGSITMTNQRGTAYLTYTAGAVAGVYTNTFAVDDTNAPFAGDDSQTVDFYVQPVW